MAAKRIYEAPVAADGTRVLIMRYWPRGIRKEKVDVWLRELAPVIPLLRAYLDGQITWAQYTPRYLAGLAAAGGAGGRWPSCGPSRSVGP